MRILHTKDAGLSSVCYQIEIFPEMKELLVVMILCLCSVINFTLLVSQ